VHAEPGLALSGAAAGLSDRSQGNIDAQPSGVDLLHRGQIDGRGVELADRRTIEECAGGGRRSIRTLAAARGSSIGLPYTGAGRRIQV
jgi:hypothetical protein